MYLQRKTTKNQAEALSIKYCTNLADSLGEAGKVPSAIYVRNMQQQQEYRTLARRIKSIEGKFRKSGTTFVKSTTNLWYHTKNHRQNSTEEGYSCRKIEKVPPYQSILPIT